MKKLACSFIQPYEYDDVNDTILFIGLININIKYIFYSFMLRNIPKIRGNLTTTS
jgi:hypothetical protein